MKHGYLICFLLLILGASTTSGMWWYMDGQKKAVEETLATANTSNAKAYSELTFKTTEEKTAFEKTIADLTTNIEVLTRNRDNLKDALDEETDKFNGVQKQVGTALKTVGKLDKLSRIDPELLQKYSKVYFLNEHYAPPKTLPIDKSYLYNEAVPQYLHYQAMPFFEKMLKDALDEGVNLYAVSAFRSFEQQQSLKNAYTVTYGSGANSFSADQGYSEHQLGTTIDFTTKGLGGGLEGFDTTPAYAWLQENGYKYGFILSYPKNNQYYIYEPWHWRFVGEELARKLHKNNENFYDLDQRDIDTYLISIFD